MVNEKSGYSKENANINCALFDFLGVDLYSFGRQVLSMFSSLDVKLVCSRKMLGHLTRSGGPKTLCGGPRPTNHRVSIRSGIPTVAAEWSWVRKSSSTLSKATPAWVRRIAAPRPQSNSNFSPPT